MSQARIELCPQCGKHGRIVLADGFVGLEFCFQGHAINLVQLGVEEFENISPHDGELLKEEIRSSSLPEKWQKVDITYHWKIEEWNQYRIDIGNFHPLGPHEFLEKPVAEKEIPPYFMSLLEQTYGY